MSTSPKSPSFYSDSELEEGEIRDDEFHVQESYIYHFDYPYLTESGFVKCYPDKIIALFPENTNVLTTNKLPNKQNVLLYINNQLKFSYQWLPIYSTEDLCKIKDMLSKCYYEFKKLTNSRYESNHENMIYFPNFHQEVITKYKSSLLNVRCFENCYNSTIEIENTIQNETTSVQKLPVVQIWIGKHLIFCSESDFILPYKEKKFLTEFILYKLVKF